MLESELVWAIQQISEELGKTSEWDIASVVISGISVILTVAVLVYNHKAIKLTQQSVQQAVNLQLFEKRLELYNAIAGEQAFYDVPLSLKIAYNQEVYDLYLEIMELCKKRWTNICEFAVLFGIKNLYEKEHGNVCSGLYAEYTKEIEHQIKLGKDGHLSDAEHKRAVALEKHKTDADLMQEKICKKYAQLEEKMRSILNQSIQL